MDFVDEGLKIGRNAAAVSRGFADGGITYTRALEDALEGSVAEARVRV